VWQLREESELEEEAIEQLMVTFFAIFYLDDAYLASRDPEFLQQALVILFGLFPRVDLETNVQKTQTTICTPGRIPTQVPTASYQQMRKGLVTAEEWYSQKVKCHQCNKTMAASSLPCHLADQHEIYQQVMVAEELIKARVGMTYRVDLGLGGKLACPAPGYAGQLGGEWMLRQHF
jgi:hypothetical protein